MQRLESLTQTLIASQSRRSIFLTKHFTHFEFESKSSLKDKVVIITGASRGLGLAMALRFARDGAKIAILAKTVKSHPKLPGTIYTAAEAITKAGGEALPIQCNMRDMVRAGRNLQKAVEAAIEKVLEKWARIDVLINNASALHIASTEDMTMKRYDLITEVNIRGTYLISKLCLPYLKKAPNPHILNVSPPYSSIQPKSIRDAKSNWFAPHVAESISKFGMTLCAYGMSAEFEEYGIGVNTIWPHTAVESTSVMNKFGGKEAVMISRKSDIFGDAAYVIVTSDAKKTNGKFFLDDEVITSTGVKDLSKYKVDPNLPEHKLMLDFFC